MVMIKGEHTIWVEKYRPKTLDKYICDEKTKAKMQEFIDKQDIPHLLFPGTPGAGKSTLAWILALNIDCDYLYLNATEERSMEDIREKVGRFAAAASFKKIKIVILDEATHLLAASQVLLLNMIETHALKTRFILTGNYVERLIPALKSRLQKFELTTPDKAEICEMATNILDAEKVKYDVKDVAFVINRYYPDQRDIINNLQSNTLKGKFTIDKNKVAARNAYLDQVITELKKPTKSSFNKIRKVIADSGVGDFDIIYKQLYDAISEYAAGNEGTVTVIIEEYLFHRNFRVDGEICFMACVNRILDTLQ
jgi:replication factor C small subunit